jgi:hypothetical protein
MRNIPWDVLHLALQEGGGPSGPAVGLRVEVTETSRELPRLVSLIPSESPSVPMGRAQRGRIGRRTLGWEENGSP